MESKLVVATEPLESLSELEGAMEENKVLCLFFGPLEGKEASTVEITAKNYPSVSFFATESAEIADEFSLSEGSFIILK